MYLRDVRSIIDDEPVYTAGYFIKTHRAIESYSNRMVLIALRLRGLKYSQAKNIINSRYLRIIGSLKHALIQIDDDKGNELLSRNSIKLAFELFLKYTSKHRNRYVHSYRAITSDDEILTLLIDINVGLLRELEYLAQEIYKHSAFDDPRAWGAGKATRDFSEEEIDAIGLGSRVKEPIAIEEARFKVAQISWEHRFKS